MSIKTNRTDPHCKVIVMWVFILNINFQKTLYVVGKFL